MTEPFQTEHNGVCLLCMKKMEEHYYSGSYETYLECKCEGITKLSDLCDKINVLKQIASKNLDKIKRKERIKELKDELGRYERVKDD